MGEIPFKAYIDEGMEIKGDIKSKNPLRIDGKIVGDIYSNSDIIIGPRGGVEGKIFGKEIVISGRVKGKLFARERINLEATSRLEADLITPILSIKEGAILKGAARVMPKQEVEREIKKEWK